MAKYDFDKIVDRDGTYSVKWQAVKEEYPNKDIIPLWVADMDFEVPREVAENISKRIEHEVFGYTMIPDSYYDGVIGWLKEQHNWDVKKDWLVFTPGVVPGINYIIRTFTKVADEIIIQTPVYHQFENVIKSTGRVVLENPLIEDEGYYTFDLDNLKKIITDRTKMLILCNPHNPVGRSWTEEELRELGEICLENDILVVSDEIHSDLVFKPNKHKVFSSLSKEYEDNSIICTAPNKTFNIAGLKTANIIIPNDKKRKEFKKELEKFSVGGPTILAMLAQESAYKYGRDWYEELMAYIEGNIDFVVKYIEEHIPKIKIKKPESTYLLWLDCRELGLYGQELIDFFIDKCGIYFNSGEAFGKEYAGYVRMNVATRRDLLEKAVKRIEDGINN